MARGRLGGEKVTNFAERKVSGHCNALLLRPESGHRQSSATGARGVVRSGRVPRACRRPMSASLRRAEIRGACAVAMSPGEKVKRSSRCGVLCRPLLLLLLLLWLLLHRLLWLLWCTQLWLCLRRREPRHPSTLRCHPGTLRTVLLLRWWWLIWLLLHGGRTHGLLRRELACLRGGAVPAVLLRCLLRREAPRWLAHCWDAWVAHAGRGFESQIFIFHSTRCPSRHTHHTPAQQWNSHASSSATSTPASSRRRTSSGSSESSERSTSS